MPIARARGDHFGGHAHEYKEEAIQNDRKEPGTLRASQNHETMHMHVRTHQTVLITLKDILPTIPALTHRKAKLYHTVSVNTAVSFCSLADSCLGNPQIINLHFVQPLKKRRPNVAMRDAKKIHSNKPRMLAVVQSHTSSSSCAGP